MINSATAAQTQSSFSQDGGSGLIPLAEAAVQGNIALMEEIIANRTNEANQTAVCLSLFVVILLVVVIVIAPLVIAAGI